MVDVGRGFDKPATRQKAGKFGKTAPLGAVYVPAGIDWAAVMVVFATGSVRPARLSHVAAAADAQPSAVVASNAVVKLVKRFCLMVLPPLFIFVTRPRRITSEPIGALAV